MLIVFMLVTLLVLLAVLCALWLGAVFDRRRALRLEARLLRDALATPGARVRPPELAQLPEPARRYLGWACAPERELPRALRLRMRGRFRLRAGAEPRPFEAEQLLAPPHGFVWRARIGRGLLTFAGHDLYAAGHGELSWRLAGLIPLVHQTGEEIDRSAAGRLLAESLWLPSVLLPGDGASWQPLTSDEVELRLELDGRVLSARLRVGPDGRPLELSMRRYRAGSAARPGGEQRFVAVYGESQLECAGLRVPASAGAGWRPEGEEPAPPAFIELELVAVEPVEAA